MAVEPVQLRPGINTQLTQTANTGGWSQSNLVRWRNGLLEKIAGWARITSSKLSGICRAMHAYEDLNLNLNLLVGTDVGPEIMVNSGLFYPFSLLRRVTYCNQGGSPSMAPNGIGSNVVTVTDNGHEANNGDTVVFPITFSIGGLVIPGGTAVTVANVTTNTWTWNLPSNATTTAVGILPQYTITPEIGRQMMTLANHGLSPGQYLTIEVQSVYQFLPTSAPPATFPSGPLQDLIPIDANNFYWQGGPYSSVDSSNHSFYEGTQFLWNGTGYTSFPNASGGPWMNYLQSAPATPQNWFVDNLGNNGLVCAANQPIYIYQPPLNPQQVILTNAGTGPSGAPQINAGMFVAMPQAQVIAFGSEAVIGGGVQDPLLLRWSDAGSYSVWVATSTNQAGSYHLSRGSRIIGGIQAPQTTIIWTDTDVWSMQYIGPPLIYSFIIVGSGCGLIAPHAAAVVGRTTYWMGIRSFWQIGDSGVEPLMCDVWDEVYTNIDRANVRKCHAGASSGTHEIFFFFPSVGGNGECDSYVKYNTMNNIWDYGRAEDVADILGATPLIRTSWIDENVFGPPLGSDLNLLVQQQETGYDADGAPMAGCFAETGFFDLANGDQIMFFDQMFPDFKWFGNIPNCAVTLTIQTVGYPGDAQNAIRTWGPYSITPNLQFVPLRIRARQAAFRIDWAPRAGFGARMGLPRFRMAPDGKRA